jgi:integrase/recombinase XerD
MAMARAASRLSRVLMTGPVAPFAEDFRRGLAERGYTPWTREHQLRQMARLSAWLEERGLAVAELSPRLVEEFLAVQRAGGRHKSELSRPGLRCLLDVLGGLGVLAGADDAPREPSPTEVLLASFEHHLLAERGLASGTVRGYVRHAACFMDGLAPKAELASLTPMAVTEAVLRESSRLSVPAAQYFLAGLQALPSRAVRHEARSPSTPRCAHRLPGSSLIMPTISARPTPLNRCYSTRSA